MLLITIFNTIIFNDNDNNNDNDNDNYNVFNMKILNI
jgi:hypothetical protein